MKIFFCADTRNELANQKLRACIKRYGQADLAKADVVVALGGDGFMLKTLQGLLNYQIPVFGLNFGHVGYLLNHYRPDELPERIEKAHPVQWSPLLLRAEPFVGKLVEEYAFNDFSVMRHNTQAARLSTLITDEQNEKRVVMEQNVFGDGIIVATPAGSHGYYASAKGQPLPPDSKVVGVTSVSSKTPFNPIVSDKAHIYVVPQEPQKRPIHVDCDGRKRFANIATVAIQSVPQKMQTLLVERNKETR